MVGRVDELATIGRLLDDARSGRSGAVTVAGEPGMGKSALLERASDQAIGMRVLRARGVQSETHIPFAALAELLRPALYLLDRLPAPQGEALQGALALIPARSQDRFAIGSATLSLLVAYGEQEPLLVTIDDAQWIDGSSADALAFAVRRLVADPVAVLVAVRTGEPSGLARESRDRLDLTGLDLDAARELITGAVGAVPDDLLGRLHRDTGGNPLALLEAARQVDSLRRQGPLDTPLPIITTVSEIYVDRIRSLGPGAASVVLVAASSDIADIAVLARAAGAIGADIADLAEAEQAGLVQVREERIEFAHPLIRSAIYNDAPPARRRAAHRALADALPDREADRRAWHLALAALGPDPVACSALEQAARRAVQRNAYEVASRAFERSSQLADVETQQADLLYRAARSAWEAGLLDRAGALIERAEPLPGSDAVVVGLEHLRGQIAIRKGPVAAGLTHLLAAADRAAAERSAIASPDDAVIILAEAVLAAFYAGDPATMAEAADRISSLRGRIVSDRAAFFAAVGEGMADTFGGRTRSGAELLRQALDISADAAPPDDHDWQAWTALGALWLRQSGTAPDLGERATETARSRTAIGALIYLLSFTAIDNAAADLWAEAESAFQQSIALARETGQWTDLCAALARLAWLEARQGQEEACVRHAEEALSLASVMGLRLCEIWARAALGDLHLGYGRNEAAMEQFVAQKELLVACRIADVDLDPTPELVELSQRSGGGLQPAHLVVAYEETATEKGLPWARARAARARAMVASDEEMTAAFERAIHFHEQTPDRFETARTQLAYGARLRRARQRVRAREQLRAAIDTFEYLGARPWADQARAELAATGETARSRGIGSRNELTPQELQIALLLSAGRTTREAAAALFLSPKTIEYHLRNVYRKLDCSNRAQLAEALVAVRTPG